MTACQSGRADPALSAACEYIHRMSQLRTGAPTASLFRHLTGSLPGACIHPIGKMLSYATADCILPRETEQAA
jgi:hypothetical protein